MVNIQDTVQLLIRSATLQTNNTSSYIFMVPGRLRDVDPKSFSPQVVSVGPLHHKNENVAAFEARKATYMHGLLHREGLPPEQTLTAWVVKVSASIHKIRECYVGIEAYSDDELAKMMVIDGCFLLEYINKTRRGEERDDILFKSIKDDVFLVENQIPFFILQDIISETGPLRGTEIMNDISLFLYSCNPFVKEGMIFENIARYDHILGMLDQTFKPDPTFNNAAHTWNMKFPSVVELHTAGVNFKPNKDEDWAISMKLEWSRSASFLWFRVKPTLRMPRLVFDDSTESRLRNLIAYEVLSSHRVVNYVRSYAIAMDMLIDTPEDIDILVKSKVCLNSLGSNEDAADMINKLCKEIPYKRFYYGEQALQLRRYCNGYLPKMALFRRTYFNSPLSVIGLLAGISLFVLTLLQTIYAMK